MIPEFPEFKQIELSDKGDIEKITHEYPPYSDFNFISMWSWDINGKMRISRLHGNLIVCFTDYISGEPFYSFLGDKKENETADALIKLSKEEGLSMQLKLVPEDSIRDLDKDRFSVLEERNNFDYIYAVDKVHSYEGSKHKTQRQLARIFENTNAFEYRRLDLGNDMDQNLLMDLVHLWMGNREEKAIANGNHSELEDLNNEYLAIKKLFSAPKDVLASLLCFSVFVDGMLCAFEIDERVSPDYCISHFGKANLSHKGSPQFLMRYSTKKLFDSGVKYYNDEQDLGLLNLRAAKSSYELAHFLKKYTITALH